MSRNLGDRSCHECVGLESHIVLEEEPRPGVQADFGGYWKDYEGIIVANARCVLCHTLYLAWVDWPGNEHRDRSKYWNRGIPKEQRFLDLSYREAFNDEPEVRDLPVYEIERVVTYRRKPFDPFHHTYYRHHLSWIKDMEKAIAGEGNYPDRFLWKHHGETLEAMKERLTATVVKAKQDLAEYHARRTAEFDKKQTLNDELLALGLEVP